MSSVRTVLVVLAILMLVPAVFGATLGVLAYVGQFVHTEAPKSYLPEAAKWQQQSHKAYLEQQSKLNKQPSKKDK